MANGQQDSTNPGDRLHCPRRSENSETHLAVVVAGCEHMAEVFSWWIRHRLLGGEG